MREVITVNVKIFPAETVRGHTGTVVMIPFTAAAEGEYFRGETIGNAADTQYISPDGRFSLSARYMLEGIDRDGNKCRVFIEDNGISPENCKPRIFTDSPALSFLEECELSAKVESTGDGVTVRIYALIDN